MLAAIVDVSIALLILTALVISCAALSGGPRPRGRAR